MRTRPSRQTTRQVDRTGIGKSQGASRRRVVGIRCRLGDRRGRAVIEDGIRLTEHFPELDKLISQAGGLPTTISFAHAQMADRPFPTQREIANRFSISASQVRNVVNTAVEARAMVRAADGAVVDASRLVDEHKSLIARELALHAKFALQLEDHFIQMAE